MVVPILSESEREFLEVSLKAYGKRAIFEETVDSVIVYHSSTSDFLESFGLPMFKKDYYPERYYRYDPMFKFQIADPDARIFTPYRWCIRGGREYWYLIGREGRFEVLLKQFLHHIDKESFYELG